MGTHGEVVHGQFDAQASAYLASAVHAGGPDLAWLRERLGTEWAGRRALDVGAGAGHLAFTLAAAGMDVTATDPSPGMMATVATEAARRGLAQLGTRTASAASLPFADASFCLVATRFSAHHWLDVPAALAEMRRVTKPGGVLLVI